MKLTLSTPLFALPNQFITITQPFGTNGEWYRENGINILGHNGIDYIARDGQEVYATHDGVVMRIETDSMGGRGLDLRTSEKYEFEGQEVYFKSRYWHLLDWEVSEGQQVKRGDVIALANNSGFSTGSHLHFELKPLKDDFTNLLSTNGYYGAIDPAPYMLQNDMEHIIIGDNQYLRYSPLKIAISIGNPEELEKLRARGLTSQAVPASPQDLNGYWVIPGVEMSALRDVLNI